MKAFLVKKKTWVIQLSFKYSKNMIENIKTLSNYQFDNKTKIWTVSLNKYNLNKLVDLNFKLDSKLCKIHKRYSKPLPKMEVEGLEGILRDYQKQAVFFIENNNGKALLAFDMGLGKTYITLSWIKKRKDLKKIIILCPSSVKIYWGRELLKFINPHLYILEGFPKKGFNLNDFKIHEGDTNLEVYIINYKIWSNDFEEINDRKKELRNTGWADFISKEVDLIVMDEAHYLSNSKSNRTKTTKRVSKKIKHIIQLTGTPLEHSPINIFPLINILDKELFKNEWKFAHRYCAPKLGRFGWDFSGANNVEELHDVLTSTYMLRKTKQEVLKELPKIQKSIIPISISNRELYNTILESKGSKYRKLLNCILDGKIDLCIDWIENILTKDEKFVIFAYHKKVVSKILSKFKDISVKIDGDTPSSERQEIVDNFVSNKNIRLLIGNIKSAGTGIDGLQKVCSNIVFLEFIYNPMLIEQAIGRLFRLGQIKGVNIYFLVAEKTIEEEIMKVLDKKRKVIDKTIDGKATDFKDLLLMLRKGVDKGEII